jgi:hypothetical protein
MGSRELFQHYVNVGQASDAALTFLVNQALAAIPFDEAQFFAHRKRLWSLRERLEGLPLMTPLVPLRDYERARLDEMESLIRALVLGRQDRITAVMAAVETAQQRLLDERQRLQEVFTST